MSYKIHIILWIPVAFARKCEYFPNKFFCTNIKHDFKYHFYKNEPFSQEYSPGAVLEGYEIQIVNSYYTYINKIINPSIQDITLILKTLRVTNCSVEQIGEDAFEELSALTTLDLSWNKIEEVSFTLPRSLENIDLSHNRIKILNFNQLKFPKMLRFNVNSISVFLPADNMVRYDFADLSYNKITEFHEDLLNCSFKTLNLSKNALENISLTNHKRNWRVENSVNLQGSKLNSITTSGRYTVNCLDLSYSNFSIESRLFKNPININEKLLMSNSMIPTLDKNLFNLGFNGKLQVDISNSSVQDISEYYFNGANLKLLNLSFNNMELIRNGVFASSTISILDMSSSKIKYIGKDAFRNVRCKEIHLYKNKLVTTENICNSGSIQKLDLSFNKIKIVQSNTFSECYDLHILNISNSLLELIESNAFSNLNDLRILDLSNNKISRLEDNGIRDLPLETLLLNSNKIKSLGYKTFINLYNLKLLNLSGCEILKMGKYTFRNMRNIEVIDLTKNNFTVLDSNTFSDLSVNAIKFGGNHIPRIKSRAFYNVDNMRVLNLSGLGVRNLEEEAFSNLKAINVIDLSNNNLTVIKEHTFFKLPLSEIKLAGNNIKSIDSFEFNKFDYLRKLNFSHWKVVPEDTFFEIEENGNIYVEGNNITNERPLEARLKLKQLTITINGVLNTLANISLRTLVFKKSKIKLLKKDCFLGMYNLNELYFHQSNVYLVQRGALNGLFNLVHLDAHTLFKHTKKIRRGTFKDLGRLHGLNLSNVGINSIESKAFSGLKKIQHLSLKSNNLSNLPVEVFYGLINLQELNLQNNQLEFLQKEVFFKLENLKRLYINNNKISYIGQNCFSDLVKIVTLFLQNNQLSDFPLTAFNGLKNLRELHLEYNSIKSLKREMFSDLTSLELLYLNNNNVRSLSSNCFSDLINLQQLFLQNNHLTGIPFNAFYGLRNLIKLNLQHNELESLQNEIFSGLKKLKWLYT